MESKTNDFCVEAHTTCTTTTETSSSPEKHNPTVVKLSTSCKRLIIGLAIFFITLTAVVVAIAMSLSVVPNNNVADTNDTNIVESNSGRLGKHYVFSKNEWGGRASLNSHKLLHHPTEYVIISHTGGRICRDFIECSSVIQQIQVHHVSQQQPDIVQNFLIGGDRNIYVGRGWDVQNSYKNNSIVIGFTGNFVFEQLNPNMIAGLKELLQKGVELKKLDPEYKLVCHNQTFSTLSPGEHVYNVISQFPHFVPGYVEIN